MPSVEERRRSAVDYSQLSYTIMCPDCGRLDAAGGLRGSWSVSWIDPPALALLPGCHAGCPPAEDGTEEAVITNSESVVVPVDAVRPYPGNARTHNLAVIRESLTEHGQYRSLVVQRSTSYILAGNGTWEAAKGLGWQEISVELVDVDDQQARKIVAVDNRASDLGGYNDDLLASLLLEIQHDDAGLQGTGFTDDDLARLVSELNGEPYDSGAVEDYEPRFQVVVECSDEQHQQDVYERLRQDGERCRVLTL